MVSGVKLLIGLAAAIGVTELACHASGRPGIGHHVHHAAKKFGHLLQHIHHGHHHGEGRHEKKCEMMEHAKICHKGCGMDHECHRKCPKPFERLRAKCAMLEPLKACHEKCHHDLACHEACPLPEDPQMAGKIKDSLKCHGACKPGDRGCHHTCGRPFVKLSQICDSMGEARTCHKSCGMDSMCHHKCPKMKNLWHCGKDHDDDHKDRREKKCEMMKYSKICHMGCGMDHECHQKCPNPLKHFQAKCAMLKPFKACHEKCHHDHACHEACPLPEDPKMADEVKDTLKCHGACEANDRGCHHACGRPFVELSQKCDSMGEVMTCHKSCGMDFMCHHKCPKMKDPWHCDKDHDDDHKDRHEKKCAMMKYSKICHMGCGMDHECHQKCPNPLKHFQAKCAMLEPLKACHEKCHHDHACHEACPLPEDPKMADEVKDTLKCHGACEADDRGCHRACGRPFAKLSQKCDSMGEAMTCHKSCGMDSMCHHKCPKMKDPWNCGHDHEDRHRYVHDQDEREGAQEIVAV